MSIQRNVFVLILAYLALLAACQAIQTTTGMGSPIEGSGNEAGESRDVSGFSSVSVAGNGTLILEQTGEESLTITADDNILPLLESKVRNGWLTLGPTGKTKMDTQTPIVYRLTVKELVGLDVSGNVAVEGTGIETGRLAINIAGNNLVTLAGRAENQDITASGNHMFNGENLAGSACSAQCSGNGMVTVNVSNRLEARTEGNCSVIYLGNPQVAQSSGGTGNVAGR